MLSTISTSKHEIIIPIDEDVISHCCNCTGYIIVEYFILTDNDVEFLINSLNEVYL